MRVRIMVIGSGGREHAITKALLTGQTVSSIYVAPGNGGTSMEDDRVQNVPIDPLDFDGLVQFIRSHDIHWTVVGPEAPLAAGIADRWAAEGLACFGPSEAAARLESSKAFSKAFMDRCSLPTARWGSFTDLTEAERYLSSFGTPPVIKASGLAAGKGVVLPETFDEARAELASMMTGGRFGGAGAEVVIEERIEGPEISLLALCDGRSIIPLPAARDHKRLLDGDRGPNTGGMGAIAPVLDASSPLYATLAGLLQRVVDGMAEAGTPYVGVLYGGFMITQDGPKILEFNCRFGDPETQVVLPLLRAGALADAIAWALGAGSQPIDLVQPDMSAATVVMASGGYPGRYPKGKRIDGIGVANERADVHVYHAGTQLQAGELVTSGGRVLSVTGLAPSLDEALQVAYAGVECVAFDGHQYRRDIGRTET